MTKDNLTGLMGQAARPIIPVINTLSEHFRRANHPVIFANDSFFPEDFLFKSKMAPHSLRYTEGSEVADSLLVEPNDMVLPKRRFSAFYKTDLDQTLRMLRVTHVYVCGITSTFCVLATAFDALSHDFYTTIVEDATCAHKKEVHDSILSLYRKNPLQPLFEIRTSKEILSELDR